MFCFFREIAIPLSVTVLPPDNELQSYYRSATVLQFLFLANLQSCRKNVRRNMQQFEQSSPWFQVIFFAD